MEDNKAQNNQVNTATGTPKGYTFESLLEEIMTIVSLPPDLIRCVFAVAVSIKLDLNPLLWLMLVGVPSSAKTDIVSLLRQLDFVYFIDSFTMNPFASGYKPTGKNKTYDLLPELDGKCFVCKDYTTIFSLNEETTKKLLGELVSIYDGEFAKFSPTRGYKTYVSSFSHIGCITPAALNHHQRYLNIVGPRFLFYRIPTLDEARKKRGFEIAWSGGNRKELIKTMGEKVKIFFKQLLATNPQPFPINDKSIQDTLQRLSLLMARSRGIVVLQKDSFINEDGKQITYYDILDRQIEEPWRALQQLKNLAISLAVLDSRDYISQDDLNLLKYIVISSMPAERADVLEYFLTNADLTAKQLAYVTGKSIRTCQRLLKELEGLDIIIADTHGESLAKTYNLQEEFSIIKVTPPASDTTSDSLTQVIPQKAVTAYTNDELEGVLQYIKDLIEDKVLTKQEKDQQLKLAQEIEAEGKRRGVFSASQLSLEDQLYIDKTI